MRKGLLKYKNEGKIHSWSTKAGVRKLPAMVHSKKGLNDNIATEKDLSKPLFSKHTAWRKEKGFEGFSDDVYDSIGKTGRPPHEPIKQRVIDGFSKITKNLKTRLRQDLLDQTDCQNLPDEYIKPFECASR